MEVEAEVGAPCGQPVKVLSEVEISVLKGVTGALMVAVEPAEESTYITSLVVSIAIKQTLAEDKRDQEVAWNREDLG